MRNVFKNLGITKDLKLRESRKPGFCKMLFYLRGSINLTVLLWVITKALSIE